MLRRICSHYSDKGRKKSINQDAFLIEELEISGTNYVLAAICDGMGGLSEGEYASKRMTEALAKWFETEFPYIHEGFPDVIESLHVLFENTDREILLYADQNGIKCGTTVAVLILNNTDYMCINVGDSRVYRINRKIKLLSKDHSVVQQLLDDQKITEEEARHHSQRNILTQCVGTGGMIYPSSRTGSYKKGEDAFLLCSDGLVHEAAPDEILSRLKMTGIRNDREGNEVLKKLATDVMDRGEKDNVSAIYIR